MTLLKAILVDDEPLALRYLESILNDSDKIDIVASCNSASSALEAINKHYPDLVFLDIQMPGKNGFELVKEIQADFMPMIVFVTAYDQFALAAFDLHAVDYLLKPLEPGRVQLSINKAIERAGNRSRDLISDEAKGGIISAIESISDKVNALDSDPLAEIDKNATGYITRKLSIKDGDTISVIDESSIDWVDAAGDYMCIHVNGETLIMRSTLNDLLSRLDQRIFKRIHRSTVVNINRIEQIQRHTKGEYFLHLDCDQILKASRHYRDVIKEIIE
jgi:two-component system, LytTR family, response regulator